MSGAVLCVYNLNWTRSRKNCLGYSLCIEITITPNTPISMQFKVEKMPIFNSKKPFNFKCRTKNKTAKEKKNRKDDAQITRQIGIRWRRGEKSLTRIIWLTGTFSFYTHVRSMALPLFPKSGTAKMIMVSDRACKYGQNHQLIIVQINRFK